MVQTATKGHFDAVIGSVDKMLAELRQEEMDDIKQTESDIQSTEDAMAEALSNRNSENEDFKAALKDDIDAVALLASAIDAMTAFYKNNKLPLGLLAKKGKVDPEYSV